MDTSSGDERRAVVVEDDEDIRELLEFTLTTQGFKVLAVGSGLAAVEAVREHQPDLVTLDLGLPGIDGIEVCRRIRDISDAYVVMITARDEEIDRLLGLETGADDFIAKPFSARELRARVNAMFRRPRTGLGAAPVGRQRRHGHPGCCGRRPRGARARRAAGRRGRTPGVPHDEELELTRTEFDLLTELMRSPARVWSREQLLRSVWGTEWASDTHLVEVHIGNLRRKLGEASGRGALHPHGARCRVPDGARQLAPTSGSAAEEGGESAVRAARGAFQLVGHEGRTAEVELPQVAFDPGAELEELLRCRPCRTRP